MGKGWICLHREILENWIFQDAASLKIWIAMLLRANHETKKTLFNGSLVTVDRGQFVFGRKKFSGELGVTESVLRLTLTRLKNDQMVNQQIFNKYSIISITNYEKNQKGNPQTKQQTTSKTPADQQQTTTSKQVNKLTNKQNNLKNLLSENKFSDDDLKLAKLIFDRILLVAPKTKSPDLDTWADTIRLMREIDGHSLEEIKQIFLFANNSDFWKSNILSVSKLRKQFATLHAQMINPNQKPKELQIREGAV